MPEACLPAWRVARGRGLDHFKAYVWSSVVAYKTSPSGARLRHDLAAPLDIHRRQQTVAALQPCAALLA